MKTYFCGDYINVEIGQEFTVFSSGEGLSVLGESAVLKKVTSQHFVFVTESGAVVKANKDNLSEVIGKAAKAGYHVAIKKTNEFAQLIPIKVSYWDSKSCTFTNR